MCGVEGRFDYAANALCENRRYSEAGGPESREGNPEAFQRPGCPGAREANQFDCLIGHGRAAPDRSCLLALR